MLVIGVFKTHFDYGYTDLAENILKKYRKEIISKVIGVCSETEKNGDRLAYRWTLPAWLLMDIYGHCEEGIKAELTRLIKEDKITCHALPFTVHTELMSGRQLDDLCHIRIDGVTFIDSAIWVCNLFACTDAVLNDIKVVGHWKYNCDGIDIVNSSDITVKNSFIRAFDDVITLKGILPYRQLPLENILVENCVLWCGWGRTLEIGLETIAEHYKNISFRNCDLIHNSAVAIDIQCGDYAEVRDISYEDIRAEYQAGSLPEQMENPIGCRYEGFGKKNTPVFIKICTQEYTLGHPFEEYDEELLQVRQGRAARVDNIRFENVSALLEEGCEPPQIILDVKEPAVLGKVTMKNVRICSAQEAKK